MFITSCEKNVISTISTISKFYELIEILNNFLNNSKYINTRVSNIIITKTIIVNLEKGNLVINA